MPHPTDADCVFCKIVAGTIPCFKLHDDDKTIAFMDINPANEGHALAVAKGHWPTVHDIPAEVIGDVAVTAKRVAAAVQKTLAPDGINVFYDNVGGEILEAALDNLALGLPGLGLGRLDLHSLAARVAARRAPAVAVGRKAAVARGDCRRPTL